MAESRPEKERKGRLLGPTEMAHQALLEQVGSSMYMHVAAIESSHVLSPDDVRKAVCVLVSKQEALQMRMERMDDEGQSLRYIPCENVDDFEMKVAEISKTDDWVYLTAAENYQIMDPFKDPLFKVIMAKVSDSEGDKEPEIQSLERLRYRYVVILKLHHALSDAKSGFDVIYRQFLPVLSAVVNGGDPERAIPFVPLCKSVEELLGYTRDDCYPPWYLRLAIGLFRWKNRMFGLTPAFIGKYPGDPVIAHLPENEMKEIPLSYPVRFGKDLTMLILKSAKSHGVSVHSVLLGACSVAHSATCHEAGIRIPLKLTFTWPVDLRKFLDQQTPLPLGVMNGNGMSSIKSKFDHTIEEFWQMCKQIYDGIKKQTKRKYATRSMGFKLLNYMKDAVKETPVQEAMMEFGFSAAGVISNLGNCDVGPKPNMTDGDVHLRMTEQYFTVSGMANMNTTPLFHTITTFQGQILWNANYNIKNISRRFIERLLCKVQEACEKYCQERKEEQRA